jgi:hypothetical protein
MSWSDVLSMVGVWLALVCASFGLSFREAVLPLFIGSNCAMDVADTAETADTDSTNTHGDEQDTAALNDTHTDRDPYTEPPTHTRSQCNGERKRKRKKHLSVEEMNELADMRLRQTCCRCHPMKGCPGCDPWACIRELAD